VGQIEDQVLCHLRQVDRELPRDRRPVVSDNRRLVAPDGGSCRDVADEQADVVVLDAFGFVTRVVAADRDRTRKRSDNASI
jgi:hypothetical protein